MLRTRFLLNYFFRIIDLTLHTGQKVIIFKARKKTKFDVLQRDASLLIRVIGATWIMRAFLNMLALRFLQLIYFFDFFNSKFLERRKNALLSKERLKQSLYYGKLHRQSQD